MSGNEKWEIDTSMLSHTLVAAIELAGKIIEWDKSKFIMINYIKGSKVEDEFLESFISYKPTIKSDKNKNSVYDWFEKKVDIEFNQPLFLNMQLVKLCQVLKHGDPGYNRLIFFIAITIINESFSWLCLHFKQQNQTNNILSSTDSSINNKPEDGYSWEFKLFGGVFSMTFTEKNVSALRIKVDKQRKSIESPLAPLIDRPCEVLIDNDDNTYQYFKLELDIALKNECTDAEINIKLTNMSEQITKLPKDSHRFIFLMRLMNDLGSAPRLGWYTKFWPYIDEYELVSILPGASISYSFGLCSLYAVQPNVPYFFSVCLEAYSHPSDFPNNLEISYFSNTIAKMVMISSPSSVLEVGETELSCPYPEFMENYTIFRYRGHENLGYPLRNFTV